MARKLTRDEIETAATMVDDIYRKEGDPEGKDAARELKARMIMCGNTDSDSIYYFESMQDILGQIYKDILFNYVIRKS